MLPERPVLHPFPLVRGVHQDVGCHAGHDAAVHFRSPLYERQLAVHDHHQVQVGERVSPSASVRAKQNDFPGAHLAELVFDAVQLALEEVGVEKSVARGLPSLAVGCGLVPVLNTGGVGHGTVSLPLPNRVRPASDGRAGRLARPYCTFRKWLPATGRTGRFRSGGGLMRTYIYVPPEV